MFVFFFSLAYCFILHDVILEARPAWVTVTFDVNLNEAITPHKQFALLWCGGITNCEPDEKRSERLTILTTFPPNLPPQMILLWLVQLEARAQHNESK